MNNPVTAMLFGRGHALQRGIRAPATAAEASSRDYRVFLSYSHADGKWARWLMQRLESYRVPARLLGRQAPIGPVGPRIAPVFRDRDELPTSGDLGVTLRGVLDHSATLVVICSPAAARSHWVNEEILAFKRLGRADRVFPFIVAGEPQAAVAEDECFPPALRYVVGSDGRLTAVPAEAIAADARPRGDGAGAAFTRLVAGLLGVGYDELRQRELHRHHRQMTIVAAGAVVGMAITLGLAASAWQARNDARRRQEQGETLLTFMLGDLRNQLEKVGQLDVLEAVDRKSLAHFAELNPRDLTDSALAQQAKTLTRNGETRMAQARYAEAARAFTTAYQRAAALAARHPQNGEMLFERGQAEYWIGFVHWTRGDLAPASEWMERYHQTSVALVALDPAANVGLSELAYSQHNLSAIDLDCNRFDLARAGFQRELVTLKRMLAASPADAALRFRVADVVSYFGTLAERRGDYPEALAQFREHTRRCAAIVQDHPRDPHWQERLANALAMEATVLEITGQRVAALARRAEARASIEAVTRRDPANLAWQRAALKLQLKEALLARAMGDADSARVLSGRARTGLAALHQAEATDRAVANHLVCALRLEAQLRDAAGRADAVEAATQAIAIGAELIAKARANDEQVGEFLRACVVAGQLAGRRGDRSAAVGHWQRAVEIAQPRLEGSSNWRLLEPAARAFALLGREEDGRALVTRLERAGYQPLEPWPSAADASLSPEDR